MPVEGGECGAEFDWCWWLVCGEEWAEEPVVDFGVEDGHPLPVGGQGVSVGMLAPFDQAVEAQPGEVVAHLVSGVGHAEQMGHLGTKAPMGESESVEADTESAEQGHDPRVAEPQGWGPPAVGGDRRLRDPLKGWARKDTALPDTFSIEQAGVDGTGLGL